MRQGFLLLVLAMAPVACDSLPLRLAGGDPRYERCQDPEARTLLARARKLIAAGGARDALPLLRQALTLCPEHVPTHILYQDQAVAVGDVAEKAMRSYYQGLADAGRSPLPPYLRARLCRHEVECKKELDEALRRDRKFAYAYLEMARMRRRVNQPEVALKEVKRALRVQPRFPAANREIAELYLELDYPGRAERHYSRYLEKRPDDMRALRAYAWLLVHKVDKPAIAEPILRDLIRKDPTNIELQMAMAAVHWLQKRLDEAIAIYRVVLRRQPNHTLAALNLADLYYDWKSKGDDAAKREAYREARKAYRYFLTIDDNSRALIMLNRMVGVPYRLRRIEEFLAKADGENVRGKHAPPAGGR